MLDPHIKEEEHGIFEELGKHFTDEQRDAMRADFVARKQKLLPIDGTQIKKAARRWRYRFETIAFEAEPEPARTGST
jgi:hypothetical protein